MCFLLFLAEASLALFFGIRGKLGHMLLIAIVFDAAAAWFCFGHHDPIPFPLPECRCDK